MDILETHAYDRRQKRNTVLFFFTLTFFTRIVNSSSFLIMCLYFFTPLPSATVLRLVFVSLAILFSLITVLLPVDCWIPRIHHLSRCQGSTCAASGCHCAELERGSECPGCGRRTDVLCCGWLLPGVARVFPAWYVPFGMTLKTLVIRPSFFFFSY